MATPTATPAAALIRPAAGPFALLASVFVIASCGLALFARAPVGGSFLTDVLPAMVLLGIGAGIAFNPLLLAAMNDVPPDESGLASGIDCTWQSSGDSGAASATVLPRMSAND